MIIDKEDSQFKICPSYFFGLRQSNCYHLSGDQSRSDTKMSNVFTENVKVNVSPDICIVVSQHVNSDLYLQRIMPSRALPYAILF